MNKRQSFQLRLPREIHQQASDRAWEERISLNQWIVEVIQYHLQPSMKYTRWSTSRAEIGPEVVRTGVFHRDPKIMMDAAMTLNCMECGTDITESREHECLPDSGFSKTAILIIPEEDN